MHIVFDTSVYIALSLLAAFSAGHALINKRDPRSALGWIITCIAIPLLGPLFYWGLGVNRIYSRAKRWQREAGDLATHPLPELKSPPLPSELFFLTELRSLSDRVVSTGLWPGNRIVPLENGEEAYPAMLAAIDKASSSIHLCTYIFDGDDTGKLFVNALARAADRGVEVRVIVDSLGEMYSRPTARELLKGSAAEFRRFLPLRPGGYLNLRNHRKILVVDGVIAFTGGMNIGRRHIVQRTGPPPVVKDLHFEVTGPVVADLQRTFLDDWRFAKGKRLTGEQYFPELKPAGSALVRAVSDGPDKDFRKLHWIILGAISCARERVTIVTPYFIPDRGLIAALVTAALRGVEVSMVLPEVNNLPFVQWASRAYLWELLQQGIRIYEQPAPFVHSKFMVVDRSWSLIGSANLDPRSLRLNFELDLEVYDLAFAALLEERCAAVVALSREITLAEVDGRPLPVKLRDGAAKLFSPYL